MIQYLDGRVGARLNTTISPDRYNAERQILSNFFNYLIGERILRENPVREVLKKKIVKNKAKECLTEVQEAELNKFLRGGAWSLDSSRLISGDDPMTIGEQTDPISSKRLSDDAREELSRTKAVAINTGLRARELVNLWWSDIDWQNKTARVSEKPDWKPKDYEERVVPLNKAALTLYSQLVSAHRRRRRRGDRAIEQSSRSGAGGRYVFPRQDGRKYGRGLDVAMCRAFRLAGFESGGLHTLRHTFATRYLAKGGTLEDLRDLLGHSDIRTTQRYLHSDSEAQRKTVERIRSTRNPKATRQKKRLRCKCLNYLVVPTGVEPVLPT